MRYNRYNINIIADPKGKVKVSEGIFGRKFRFFLHFCVRIREKGKKHVRKRMKSPCGAKKGENMCEYCGYRYCPPSCPGYTGEIPEEGLPALFCSWCGKRLDASEIRCQYFGKPYCWHCYKLRAGQMPRSHRKDHPSPRVLLLRPCPPRAEERHTRGFHITDKENKRKECNR